MATQDEALTSDLLANQSGSALRLLGGVLDAPGSGIRNILAGRNPFRGLFDLDRRVTGRALAEQYGLGANTPGLDTGDVIGFLTDVFTDPLTYLTLGGAAASKAGKIAQAADLMPGAVRDIATGELMKGRRTLARTTKLGERLKTATPAQKLQAEAVAKQLGTTLEKEAGDTLRRDVAIDVPFLGRLAEFDILPTSALEALDQAGHTLRASPVGRLHAQLFTKGAQGTKSLPVQIAMDQATREADMAARKYAEEAAQARMDLGSIGLTDTNEYRRFVRGAAELSNPMRPTKKFSRLEDAVQANLPDRLRTPENIAKAAEIIRRVIKNPTEMKYSMAEQYGVAPPRTADDYADFMHRDASDPDKLRSNRGKQRAIKTQDIYGGRSFANVPGGANVIEDIMNDKEVYDIMQQGYRERNLAAAPREKDLKSLEQMGFGGPNDIVQKGSKEVEVQPYDRQDLTRNQAKKMVNMGERDAKQISRAQMPPEKYQNFTPPQAVDLIAKKHFKWDEYDFEEYANLKAQKANGELDDASEAALQAYEDQRKVAADLANAVSVRPLELIEAKRPYYGNDPLLDQMGYIAHSHEKAAYAKQMLQLGGLSAQRIVPGTGVFKFTEEFPGKMKPEGMTSLSEFIDNVTDPGFRKDPKAYRNDYGKSFAIRAIAPDLHKAGLIDKETLDNIVGDHAVYESNITSFRQAKDRQARQEARRAKVEKQFDSGKLSEAQYTAKMDDIEAKIEAASAAQVHKYDGLMALNQVYVPDYIVEDMARIQGTLKDSNMMRGFLKYYDKALNITKSNLTQPWPGFHVRNAYNMAWQMIVSGSYDPTYKRYDPRAYIKPLSDASKLIRGEAIADAVKYFPAETLTNEQAMEKLRGLAFAHNTASGQHVFHSESNDVVGGFAEMTPDILKAMPGTVPEGKPGIMGMGYLAQGWKDLFTGKGGRNPLNVPGGREGKAYALQQGGAKTSTYVESVGRTATMMARMKQGFDPDLAAMMSNAAHVRYDNLSNFEKQVMKRLVPFWSYARGMIPWQLKHLAEHPGGVTAQTIRQFERAKGQGGFVPDYLQGSLAIPVGSEDKEGKQTFVTGFDLPFESINDYFRYGPDMMSTAGRTLREIGGQLSPALQLPAELAFNQSLYQGRNLKELDPALGRIAANITGQDDPPFKTGLLDQLLMKSPASRYLATLKTLTDPRDPLVEQAVKKPLQLGTGVRFKDVNVEQQKDFAILEAIKDQAKGDRKFVTGEYITVKKDKMDNLTDRQKRLLELYRERSKAIQDRKKA